VYNEIKKILLYYYCYLNKEEMDTKPWYHDIQQLIKNREYITDVDKKIKKKSKKDSHGFLLRWRNLVQEGI